jgi:hypothetical protein
VASGGRALGIGLLAGAAGVTLLLLAWLAVTGAAGGGIVLGLLLLLIIAGPLAGGGWYVLSRQPAEEQSAIAFGRKQRVLDSDRVFRSEIAGTLRSLASLPDLPASDLRMLADDLQNPAHGSAAWQDLVQLDDDGLDTLRRYDDLVRERVRRLRDHPDHAQTAFRELRRAVDQREDLLRRGRSLPDIGPTELLTVDGSTDAAAGLERIGLRDAVTLENTDYVVENVASYFAEGRRWRLARLVPTGGDASAVWLYVGPGATDIAVLGEVPPPADGPPQIAGAVLAEDGAGTAVVDVEAGPRSAQGVLVSYRRYRDAAHFALVEQWPDDVHRAYAGSLVKATSLELWPTA